ncbi:HAMP domain-containing sensor histidine kinase [Clostridium sp. MB40-C1]|uniref:sensor histidine kinase n=1 Tax=Clostridium sp. MB40-C1 TaxID=3070996 RepID=UPI0027DF9E63|nr:HAMP domain-containing sensor histidine kinase [Clostridium sp. MB40-C1]WMJ80485.1 HAMP domain-containing sensor histidine kinase [Clostridium sp. MB40-C1]
MKGIKQRIYTQNSIIIVSIVIILEIIFIFSVKSYYIKSAEYQLINKAEVSSKFYNKYLINENIYEKARYMLENESRDNTFYMQFFDLNRNLIIDSNGFKSNEDIKEKDILAALNGKIETIKIKDKFTKESTMSVSVPLYHLNEISGVLRYSISISQIEKTILNIIIGALLIGGIVIGITFFFSSILADKIVYPIENLTKVAETMALGDFSKRIKKINNDEIGKLSDTLNYMAEEIQKSNAVKNEFISSISHELRTPLTAIRGWSEIINSGEINDEEEIREGLDIILSETKRLTGLVEELLDFSKLEMGKISLNLQNTNINSIVMEIYNYFKSRFKNENVKCELNIGEENFFTQVDVNRFKQVLINIIDNAIKFSDENGKIIISTFLHKENIIIKVEDNGIGIDKDDLHRVTEKFYKGKSRKSGSGIGLSICNEIVNLHGGKLVIDSAKGEGTSVTIYIPTKYE